MKTLILSDVHANWPALRAVLESESDADHILCLGDLVNYGPQPAECVAWAMEMLPPENVIQGNHDRAFARETTPRCCPANQQLAESVQTATNPLLTAEMKDFLESLQPSREFRCEAGVGVACHSHSPDKQDAPPDPHFGEENAGWSWESDIILLGHPDNKFVLIGHPDFLFRAHTHVPMKTRWGRTLAVNPGSVGRPTNGDPRAAYAVWHDGEVTLQRVGYDVEETVRAFQPLDLDEDIKQQLIAGLRTGRPVSTRPALELAGER